MEPVLDLLDEDEAVLVGRLHFRDDADDTGLACTEMELRVGLAT